MNYLPFAEQCNLIEEHPVNHSSAEYLADLQRFAELVAAHEREECVQVCDELVNDENGGDYAKGAEWCAIRIRARGQE